MAACRPYFVSVPIAPGALCLPGTGSAPSCGGLPPLRKRADMSSLYAIDLTHNFETAHRLSHEDSPTKCRSIHGHSWWVKATIEGAGLDDRGMLVEFGAFKSAWRRWLDDHVDHHLAIQQDDPVGPALLEVWPQMRLLKLPFDPTTEQLARWLFEHTERLLGQLVSPGQGVRLREIHLQETRVNAASYARRPGGPD